MLMNEVTLQLPKTLYRHLENLAKKEDITLNQYILYALTRQMSDEYMVRVVPEEDGVRQKESFDDLLRKWGKAPPSEVDKILDSREPVKPEADLDPEAVRRLKTRIASSKSNDI
jgi:hypothetical protein